MKENKLTVVRQGFTKAKLGLIAGVSTAMVSPLALFNKVTVNENLTQGDGIGAIMAIIFEVSKYIGMVSVVMGVFLTVQSFMSDNPEKRNQGVTLAIVGAVLIGLKTLLKTAGILT